MDLFEFERARLRLKQAVGLQTDKEIAELLGLDASALNTRKTRGSFPRDALMALAESRPELKIDVTYVLSGIGREQMNARIAGLGDRIKVVRGGLPVPDFAARLGIDEAELLRIERGEKTPSSDAVIAVINAYPEVDPLWLASGERTQLDGDLSHDEVVLVSNYRMASAEGRELVRRLAASAAMLAGRTQGVG